MKNKEKQAKKAILYKKSINIWKAIKNLLLFRWRRTQQKDLVKNVNFQLNATKISIKTSSRINKIKKILSVYFLIFFSNDGVKLTSSQLTLNMLIRSKNSLPKRESSNTHW